jgi:hypothetical protein
MRDPLSPSRRRVGRMKNLCGAGIGAQHTMGWRATNHEVVVRKMVQANAKPGHLKTQF